MGNGERKWSNWKLKGNGGRDDGKGKGNGKEKVKWKGKREEDREIGGEREWGLGKGQVEGKRGRKGEWEMRRK